MALKVGELYAALALNSSAFKKGLGDAHGGAKKWAGNMGRTFQTAGKVIAAGLAIGIAAIAAVGVSAMKNAEEQERANARVKAVYGEQADAVNAWASANSRAMGVNDDVLQQSMAKYGQWAQNVGFSVEESISQGQALATRAEEIARSTGKPFEEVFAALMKGAQGSTRGLKEYGVAVSPLAIKNEALRLGLIKAGEALTDEAKAAALNSLIMNQTAGFIGSAADASDSLAFKQRQMGAVIDEVMDQVGVLFLDLAMTILPIVADAFAAVAAWVQENWPTIQTIFETVMAAIGDAFKIVSDAITNLIDVVWPPLEDAFNWLTNDGKNLEPILAAIGIVIMAAVVPAVVALVTSLGPLLLAIGAVIAIVAVLVKAWMEDWGGIRTTLMKVWKAIEPIFNTVVKWLGETIPKVVDALVPVFQTAFSVIGTVIDVAVKAIGIAFAAIGKAVEILGTAFENLKKGIKAVWDGITGIIKTAINIVIGLINGIIGAINGIQVHVGIDAPDPIPDIKFDWNGLNLPKLPYLAKGMWEVRTPMPAMLHAGEMVLPAAAAARMRQEGNSFGALSGARDKAGGPLIGTQVIHGVLPGDVERETKRAFRRQALDWQLEGR